MKFQPAAKKLAIALTLFLGVFFAGHGYAANIAKGYLTDDNDLKLGMVASLAENSDPVQQRVERAGVDDKDRVVGIVTTIDDGLVTLTDKTAKVHVASSGETRAYVSDIGGEIKRGDFLTVSALKGILMRANGGNNQSIVGLALADTSSVETQSIQVEETSGGNKTVKVALLPIEISQRVLASEQSKDNFLRLFGQSLTGKTVSPLQVIVAMVIFFIVLIVEGSVIYGAIYSSIISIGRNPLSKRAVYRQLAQVSLLVLLVLTIGLGAVYAVLWV